MALSHFDPIIGLHFKNSHCWRVAQVSKWYEQLSKSGVDSEVITVETSYFADVYNCQGGFVMSPYVYVLMADSKDTTKQYCLVLVAERNILLMLLFKTSMMLW